MKAIKKEIKRTIKKGMELHRVHWTTNISSAAVNIGEGGSYLTLPNDNNPAPAAWCLNGTLQGVDSNQRVGNQIKEDGLRIRGIINQQSTTALQGSVGVIRITVFRDHDNKGTVPTSTDLWEFPASSGSAQGTGTLIKWSNRKRFSILFDELVPLQPGASNGVISVACAAVDIKLKLSKLLTMSANTRDASSIADGGIYCFMEYCNLNTNPATAECPQFHGCVAFTYYDV